MAEQRVIVDVREGIARVRLDAPKRRNALGQDLLAELTEAIGLTAADPEARVIIVEAAGPAFSGTIKCDPKMCGVDATFTLSLDAAGSALWSGRVSFEHNGQRAGDYLCSVNAGTGHRYDCAFVPQAEPAGL